MFVCSPPSDYSFSGLLLCQPLNWCGFLEFLPQPTCLHVFLFAGLICSMNSAHMVALSLYLQPLALPWLLSGHVCLHYEFGKSVTWVLLSFPWTFSFLSSLMTFTQAPNLEIQNNWPLSFFIHSAVHQGLWIPSCCVSPCPFLFSCPSKLSSFPHSLSPPGLF